VMDVTLISGQKYLEIPIAARILNFILLANFLLRIESVADLFP
jgi:hypothetical protein